MSTYIESSDFISSFPIHVIIVYSEFTVLMLDRQEDIFEIERKMYLVIMARRYPVNKIPCRKRVENELKGPKTCV